MAEIQELAPAGFDGRTVRFDEKPTLKKVACRACIGLVGFALLLAAEATSSADPEEKQPSTDSKIAGIVDLRFIGCEKLVAVRAGGRADRWKVKTAALEKTFQIKEHYFIALSDDGTRIASEAKEGGTLVIQDVITGKEVARTDKWPKGSVRCRGVFSSDNHFLVRPAWKKLALGRLSKSKEQKEEAKQLQAYDLDTDEEKTSRNRSVAFAPDRSTLAFAGDGDEIILWDVARRIRLKRIAVKTSSSLIETIVFSPDRKSLAVATWDSNIVRLHVETGEVTYTLDLPHGGLFLSCVWPPDGKWIAASTADLLSSEGWVVVWDAKNGKRQAVWKAHSSNCNRVIFGPEEGTLATGGDDGIVKLWNWKKRELIREYRAKQK